MDFDAALFQVYIITEPSLGFEIRGEGANSTSLEENIFGSTKRSNQIVVKALVLW